MELKCLLNFIFRFGILKNFVLENIMWLSVDNIREKDDCVISGLPDLPQLVGSGQSVGGVVSETVGASSADDHNSPLQVCREIIIF